tara:strand:- start:7784 stop:10582 length:2799 start_codon:yes stop_codon:yes gene_type:complete
MVYDFKKVEEEAKKVWKSKKKGLDKAIQDRPKRPLFSFLEGPPTANAPPGLHHLEVRTFKDIICKFKYMQGFSVPRKGGWDTHGLPVEVQVEKSLGLKSKKEVLDYGMDKFIKKSRESVFSNIKDWEKSTEDLNYMIDLKDPYITLDNDYIESVWWSLKELYKKDLLYEGYKVVPFCTRCGTPLSSHEVSQGYKDVTEESVYVAFKLKTKGEYILAWTTTPWTLLGNVGLAVGKNIDYVKVELEDGDKLIVGKEKLDLIHGKYKIVKEMKGKDLVGLEYEPLFDIKEIQNENSHKVILADFVTTEDGTGIVHTAGMYGEADYDVCKENNIPLVHTVGQDGKYLDVCPKEFVGRFVKSAEEDIKEDLRKRHLLFKKEKTTHSYPFCWRCDSPLLYYAINSWFIRVTKVKDKMVKLNKQINWSPSHIKDGRFGKWLEGIRDWALSRFKFWGTPLPVWRCDCGKEKIIGSVKELRESSVKKFDKYDLHRPWIDKIKLKCDCGKEMSRIPDLIDVWYDSGSAPFAQLHYPFENKEYFKKRFPYDYISEAIDQTRGWFYTMHAISTMLFGKVAYKNVICAGFVVDEKGEKMSKSKGNIIKPDDMISKTGVDSVRLQMCTSDAGNDKRFSYDLVREYVLPFLTVLYNSKSYYDQLDNKKTKLQVEDKWIISKLNSLIEGVTKDLEEYKLHDPAKRISDFVVNDLSRGYIKMTRDREDTREVLGEVLDKVSLLLAPFAPYISEYIHKGFSKESIPLSKWPKLDKKKVDKTLEKNMEKVMGIIESGLAERDRQKIGLKWPLSKATISSKERQSLKNLEGIIKSQLNVKQVELRVDPKVNEITVELDTSLTPELEAEGYAREVSRKVQAFRKDLGFNKKDQVETIIIVDEEFKNILDKQEGFLKERTNSKKLEIVTTDKERFKNKVDFKIRERRGVVVIRD